MSTPNQLTPDQILQQIQSHPISNSGVGISIYAVKRRVSFNTVTYSAFKLECDQSLEANLSIALENGIRSANSIAPYAFESPNHPGQFLHEDASLTEMSKIETACDPIKSPSCKKAEELADCDLLVLEASLGSGERLLAVKRVIGGWVTKRQQNMFTAVFVAHVLKQETKDVFHLPKGIDFFSCLGRLFVLDKKGFEFALNFRVGMERRRDSLLASLQSAQVLSTTTPLSKRKDELRLLRLMASVERNGYYKDPNFLTDLRKISVAEGWSITWDSAGAIECNDLNVEQVLHFLNDDRLMSLISKRTYDINGSKVPV